MTSPYLDRPLRSLAIVPITRTKTAKWALELANDPQSALTKWERQELKRRVSVWREGADNAVA